jgi:hypothetical protein
VQADLDRQRDRERERENRERADTMRASLIGQRKSGLAGAPPERFAPGITAAVDARLAQQAAISAAESKSQYAIERGGLSNVVKKKKIDNTFCTFTVAGFYFIITITFEWSFFWQTISSSTTCRTICSITFSLI